MTTINDICDVAKLRRCNDLLWKWFCRSGEKQNKYYSWVIACWQNPERFKKTLTPPMKSAFAKEVKFMFYAAEIEEAVIKQYEKMIPHVLKKLKFQNHDFDDLYQVGMHAIRKCVWHYRNMSVKCGLTTFCFNSIFLRIRGQLSKVSTLKNRREKKFSISFENEMDVNFKLSNSHCRLRKHKEIEFDETPELLKKILQKADFKQDEVYLIELLLKRHDHIPTEDDKLWYSKYLSNFAHTFPKNKITREGFRQRLLKLQQKFWFYYRLVQNLPITEMPAIKMRSAI